MPLARAIQLRALRAKLSAFDPALRGGRTLSFGDGRVDGCFPGGGLPLGCWHELVGAGTDTETAASTAAFGGRLAAVLARAGQVVWVLRREDLYAPGLAELGLGPDRLVIVRTGSEAETLAALEDALRTRGIAAAVGEIERVGLTAGRRLQLACERHKTTGLVIKRRVLGGAPKPGERSEPAIAASRWRITPAPSEPETGAPGLGAPRWEVRLERARGARTGAWIMEAQNGPIPFRVVAELADHQLAATPDPQDQPRRAVA